MKSRETEKPIRRRRAPGMALILPAFVLALLSASLYLALFTTAGARWIISTAISPVPGLSLRVLSGRLWDGLDVGNIQFRESGSQIEVDSLDARWSFHNLHRRVVGLTSLRINGVRVNMDILKRDDPKETKEPGAFPMLPVALDLGLIEIRNVNVRAGYFNGQWERMAVSAFVGENFLRVDGIYIDGLKARREDSGAGNPVTSEIELNMELTGIKVSWNEPDIQARPQSSAGIEWLPEEGRVTWQDEAMRIDAFLQGQLGINGRWAAEDLSALHPEANGIINGYINAQGALTGPDISLYMEGRNLGFAEQLYINDMELDVDLKKTGMEASAMLFKLGGIRLPDRELLAGDLMCELNGTLGKHDFLLGLSGGAAALNLHLSGCMDNAMNWTGSMEEAGVGTADFFWELKGRPALIWEHERKQAMLAGHEWRHGSARLVVPDMLRLGAEGTAGLHLKEFDVQGLETYLPPDIKLSGLLDIEFNAEWKREQLPAATMCLNVLGGALALIDPDAPEYGELFAMPIENLSLNTGLKDDLGWLKFDMQAEQLGKADADVTLQLHPDGTPGLLQGTLNLDDLRIGVVRPFIPMLYSLDGRIDAHVNLTGDVKDPHIKGSLSLSGASVEAHELPVNLSGIEIHMTVDGQVVDISGGFQSGDGKATLQGMIDLSEDTVRAEARMTGESLYLAYADFATMSVDTDIKISVDGEGVWISGSVYVPESKISIRELPETAVSPSSDIVVREQQVPDDTQEDVGEKSGTVVMELKLVLGDRVSISGYGLNARLEGGLDIRQVMGESPNVVGEITIHDGRYRAYGQRLFVRRGVFLFAGPADRPDLYIEAVRPVPAHGVVAGLRVDGHPESPRMILFSEPSLPEEEILSFLILGRPFNQAGDDGVSLLALAAVSLGVAGGNRLAGMAEEMGIKEMELDTAGTGEDTQVVISGRVGPRMHLSYGVGVFSPITRLMMRYQLVGNLFLEAVASSENSIDLFYTFGF